MCVNNCVSVHVVRIMPGQRTNTSSSVDPPYGSNSMSVDNGALPTNVKSRHVFLETYSHRLVTEVVKGVSGNARASADFMSIFDVALKQVMAELVQRHGVKTSEAGIVYIPKDADPNSNARHRAAHEGPSKRRKTNPPAG
jgi:hypothetical protein